MNRNTNARQTWMTWAATADEETKATVSHLWSVFGPLTLVHADQPPHCVNCGGHNANRYGPTGSLRCDICNGVAA